MTNDAWRPRIEQYLDAELSDEEMRSMDAHLRECPSCTAETLHQTQLRNAIRAAGRRYVPSTEFRRRIHKQVTAEKPARRSWVWMPAFALAMVLIIVAGMLLSHFSREERSQTFVAELTDIHVANLASSTPVDVVSSDRHTVKPWFQGKLPFTFNLPELQGSRFALVGGRTTYLNHEPGAHLIYDIGGHHVSVLIFRDAAGFAEAFPPQSSQDVLKFHVEAWASQGLRYFVVGDASERDIQELSRLWKNADKN